MSKTTQKEQYEELANKILARRKASTNTNVSVSLPIEGYTIEELRDKCDCAGVKYKKRDNKTILLSKLES